ncbi:MAG: ribosome maturation factor RimP [Firmicutes bacterium]|nr:ribosome maturation factor RimP [Bacillota bacterium]MDD7601789.1 ribosome maturation factor RimP [Bacillota bacterium]MDY5855499.1 ribosome maturation factor RimP [Anaerovoracaceae bacterium]
MAKSKGKVTDLVKEIAAPFLDENGLELYNVEFLKEGKDWFLRVFIDKSEDAEEEYVSTDDCEKVSRYLSAELDRIDPIEQNYYLEVSSPGMDRALLKDSDFTRYAGRLVDLRLYRAADGRKDYQGILKGLEDGQIVIEDETGKECRFDRTQVAKTSLAVVF